MEKYIIKRKSNPFSYFKWPNSDISVFQLIKVKWFSKVIFESHDISEVRKYAAINRIYYTDHTFRQIQGNSKRPIKVN